jgi:phenylacetate-CoA ligase
MLTAAGKSVPYYRDLFNEISFDPLKVEKDAAYLGELPFLTKDIIREQGERLLDENVKRETLHARRTGGSTGPAVIIHYSQEALDWTAAVNLFVLEWAGKKRHMKEAHLSSRFPEAFPLKDRIKEYIKCIAINRVNIMTDSFDPDALMKAWRRLKSVKPYLIQGHPSTLYALAMLLRDNGEGGEGVIDVFESTGELLDRKKRERIEDVFKCRVFDRYGNAEFGVVAHETGEEIASLRVVDFMVWPESVPTDEGGHEIVLTGLTNSAMPLVRYRTGDFGELESREDGFYLSNLMGRVHDIVRIGERTYPTHYIQDLLDRVGGIDEFQVETRNGGPLLLRLVVPDHGARDALRERIKGWWGDDVEVEFTDLTDLKRVGSQGKFRYLVEQNIS